VSFWLLISCVPALGLSPLVRSPPTSLGAHPAVCGIPWSRAPLSLSILKFVISLLHLPSLSLSFWTNEDRVHP